MNTSRSPAANYSFAGPEGWLRTLRQRACPAARSRPPRRNESACWRRQRIWLLAYPPAALKAGRWRGESRSHAVEIVVILPAAVPVSRRETKVPGTPSRCFSRAKSRGDPIGFVREFEIESQPDFQRRIQIRHAASGGVVGTVHGDLTVHTQVQIHPVGPEALLAHSFAVCLQQLAAIDDVRERGA